MQVPVYFFDHVTDELVEKLQHYSYLVIYLIVITVFKLIIPMCEIFFENASYESAVRTSF